MKNERKAPGDARPRWTRYDYPDGTSVWQRECENCDKGLLFAPVRNCPMCHGTGWITTAVESDNA